MRFDQNFEAEVLCCCLSSDEGCDIALQSLTPKDFYNATNAKIFGAIQTIAEKGDPVIFDSVFNFLRQHDLDEIGDFNFVKALDENKRGAANAAYYVKQVLAESQKRRMNTVLLQGASEVTAPLADMDTVIAKVQNEISEIYGNFSDQKESVRVLDEILLEIESGWQSNLKSGFADLDNLVDFSPPQLILIGASPKTGKSVLAFQLFLQWWKAKIPVAYFSNEMTPKQLFRNRYLPFKTGINAHRIRLNRTTAEEKAKLKTTALEAFPLLENLYHREAGYITRFGARCRQLFRKKPGVAFLDFIQRVNPPSEKEGRHFELDLIARQMADLARALNITIIACSQLNRLAKKENRPPRLHDLRESGGLEESADTVLLLHAKDENEVEVNIAKNRHDEEGFLTLRLNRDFARFDSVAIGREE